MNIRKYELITTITDRLSNLSDKIRHHNKMSLTDINKACEPFFCTLLNFIYGYELVDINIDEENAVAIDLGDKKLRIAIQVTSENRLEKSRRTLKKFVENKLYEEYDRLIILQIVEKIRHRGTSIVEGQCKLDTIKDIIDINDLINDIKKFDTEKIEKLFELIVYETSSLLDEVDYLKKTDIIDLSQKLQTAFRPENLIDHFPEASIEVIDFLTELKKTTRYIYEKENVNNKKIQSERTIISLIEKISKYIDKIDGENNENNQENTDTKKSDIKKNQYFIVAAGGSGKTVTMWNTCKFINENLQGFHTIYIDLSIFDSIESIDEFFLKISNFSLTNLLKKNFSDNLILLLDGWDEFRSNTNKQEYKILLSLIEKFPTIIAGRHNLGIPDSYQIWYLKEINEKKISKTIIAKNLLKSNILESPIYRSALVNPLLLNILLLTNLSSEFVSDYFLEFTRKLIKKNRSISEIDLFLKILSKVAMILEFSKTTNNWNNFHSLVIKEAKKSDLKDVETYLSDSSIVQQRNDIVKPVHELVWDWLIGKGILEHWDEINLKDICNNRNRARLTLAFGPQQSLPDLNSIKRLINIDTKTFATFYYHISENKYKKRFFKIILRKLKSKVMPIRYSAIEDIFISGNVDLIKTASKYLEELALTQFPINDLKKYIKSEVLWNCKENLPDWFEIKSLKNLLFDIIIKSSNLQWSQWFEDQYKKGEIEFLDAALIVLSSSNTLPHWIKSQLPEAIRGGDQYRLSLSVDSGLNIELAYWVLNNYEDLLPSEYGLSSWIHLNDVLKKCGDKKLFEKILNDFNTYTNRKKEYLSYIVEWLGAESIEKLQVDQIANSETSVNHIFFHHETGNHDEKVYRNWIKSENKKLQRKGWVGLALKYQCEVLQEILDNLPQSFGGLHEIPELQALAYLKEIPSEVEEVLYSKLSSPMQPMAMQDFIAAVNKIKPIGIYSIYKRIIEHRPTALHSYHYNIFLKALSKWQRDNSMKLRIKFQHDGIEEDVLLTDYLIFQYYGKSVDKIKDFYKIPFDMLSSNELKMYLLQIIAPDENKLKFYLEIETLPLYDKVLLYTIFEIFPVKKAFEKIQKFVGEFGVEELNYCYNMIISTEDSEFYSYFLNIISNSKNEKFKLVYSNIYKSSLKTDLSLHDLKNISKLLSVFNPLEFKKLFNRFKLNKSSSEKIIIKYWEDEKNIKIVDERFRFFPTPIEKCNF